jgi:hypothetical protein
MGIQTYGVAATATSHKEAVSHGAGSVDERRPVVWLTKSFRWVRELTRDLAVKGT